MNNPEVLIRKYSDRRLYDTGASRYVKLDDIARMVRDGINVRVVDGRTGKDLTHLIFHANHRGERSRTGNCPTSATLDATRQSLRQGHSRFFDLVPEQHSRSL